VVPSVAGRAIFFLNLTDSPVASLILTTTYAGRSRLNNLIKPCRGRKRFMFKSFRNFGVILILLVTGLFTTALVPGEKSDEYGKPGAADKTLAPYFVVLSDDPKVDALPLKSTRADVKIAGVVAEVKITQVYRNTGQKTLEAIYVFPGSTRADHRGAGGGGQDHGAAKGPGNLRDGQKGGQDRLPVGAAAPQCLPDEPGQYSAQ
jgi:hypothetical protein